METTTGQVDEAAAQVTAGAQALGAAAGGLLEVAGLWLQHGLRVSRLSLEASAHTLERVAAALGELSQRVERRDPPESGS